MFQAVTRGWINTNEIFPTKIFQKGSRWYHIEAVEKVYTKKILGLMETDEITTHDIIMNHCCFCGAEL